MKQRQWLALILSLMLLASVVPASAQSAKCPDHHFVKTVQRQPTCTEWGLALYKCPNCGESYQDEIEPLGHNWYWYKTTATCTGNGLDYYRCARCGAEKTERRGPLGHDYGERQVDIPATCTDPGRDVRICSRDHTHVWYFDTEPLGHDWGDWEVVTPATTTSPGLEKRVCKRDPSHVETRDIPKLEGGEEDLPIAEIDLSASCVSGPYHVGQVVEVDWVVENIGDVPVTYRDSDGDAAGLTFPEVLEPGQTFSWRIPHAISIDNYNDGFYISSESGETCDTPFEYSNIVFYANVEYVYDPGYGNLWECFDEVQIIELLEQGVEGPSLYLDGTLEPVKMKFDVNETVDFHIRLTNNGSEPLELCSIRYLFGFSEVSTDTYGTLAPGESFTLDYSYTFPPEMANALIPFEWYGCGYRIGGLPYNSDDLFAGDNPSLIKSNSLGVRLQVNDYDGPSLSLTVDQTDTFKTEYEKGDNPAFHTLLTNTGTVPLTNLRVIFWDENGTELDGWPNEVENLAPGESFDIWGWNHTIKEEDLTEPALVYHWKGYAFEEGTYAAPGDPNAPGDPEGIVWSNECTEIIPLKREGPENPLLWLGNVDGSGAGKGLNDWVTTQLTLENQGDTLLQIRAIVYAAPSEYGAALGNYDSTEWYARIEGTTYWVTETDTFNVGIQVLPADVAKGAVDREIWLIANLPGQEEPFVYSNHVSVHIPLDTEPVPPDDKEASIALIVTCPDPEPFWFDFEGYSDFIHYPVTVINTGNVPVELTEMHVEAEGDSTVIDLGFLSVCLLPGDVWNYTFLYKYEENQVVNGNELHIAYTAVGDSQVGPVTSNEVSFIHEVGEQPPWAPDPTTVFMIKMVTGGSENLGGYVEGEDVTYDVVITNTSEVAIPALAVSDDHCPGQDAIIYDLQPGETRTVPFKYTVTHEDVEDGFIINTATVTWTCPITGTEQKEESSVAVDTTEITDKEQYGFDLMKVSLNAPKDGPYYQEGELVTFYIYLENTSTAELYDVNLTDPLTGDTVHYDVMTPGQIDDLYFTYTITYPDAYTGSLTNTVTVTGHDADGKEYAMTDNATIPTGIPPVPGTPSLYLFKEVTNNPLDSNGYQEGEVIDYKITVTNDGDVDLYNIDVYDINPDAQFIVLGTIPLLHPGDSLTFNYSWTVEDWNVFDEWVWNSAIAYYSTETVSWIPVLSNETQTPTWAPTPPPPPPPTKTPGTGAGESCEYTLTASGSKEIWYELNLCPNHADALAKAEEFTADSKFDDLCELWLGEIGEMYDLLAQKTVSKDRVKVAADRAALEHIAANMEDSLEKADWLMLQCTELCYLNGNAPADRPDSMIFGRIQSAPSILMAGGSVSCGLTVQSDGSRTVQIVESLCKSHEEGEATILTMLGNSRTRDQFENVFVRAQRLWRSHLDEATSAAWKAAAPEAQSAVVTSRQAFDQWLTARTELLAVLYPDNPETVAEVLSGILRRQVLLMCQK
ncbi:MAG: hypothetical protein IK127_03895 [Clostridia bacterium]|nr:hypothetical protein [Clostridia bacterium]